MHIKLRKTTWEVQKEQEKIMGKKVEGKKNYTI